MIKFIIEIYNSNLLFFYNNKEIVLFFNRIGYESTKFNIICLINELIRFMNINN